jgi:hypothetical protein
MTLEPHSFEFLLDTTTRHHPVIGLRVNPIRGAAVTIPLPVETAESVGALLMAYAHHIGTALTEYAMEVA